eukprot:2617970-Amphidinium_carterae.2
MLRAVLRQLALAIRTPARLMATMALEHPQPGLEIRALGGVHDLVDEEEMDEGNDEGHEGGEQGENVNALLDAEDDGSSDFCASYRNRTRGASVQSVNQLTRKVVAMR